VCACIILRQRRLFARAAVFVIQLSLPGCRFNAFCFSSRGRLAQRAICRVNVCFWSSLFNNVSHISVFELTTRVVGMSRLLHFTCPVCLIPCVRATYCACAYVCARVSPLHCSTRSMCSLGVSWAIWLCCDSCSDDACAREKVNCVCACACVRVSCSD